MYVHIKTYFVENGVERILTEDRTEIPDIEQPIVPGMEIDRKIRNGKTYITRLIQAMSF